MLEARLLSVRHKICFIPLAFILTGYKTPSFKSSPTKLVLPGKKVPLDHNRNLKRLIQHEHQLTCIRPIMLV